MADPDDRVQLALQAPTPLRLHRFPQARVSSARQLYRAHRTALAPWYFTDGGTGRFDLATPQGTCYLAEGAVAALREALGLRLVAPGVVYGLEVDSRQVSALRMPSAIRVADTTAAGAANHGITREISTVVPYDIPQAWATAWAGAGSGGVRYLSRLSTAIGADARCLAVFGPAGPGAAEYLPDPAPAPGRLVAAQGGIRMVDNPPRSALTVVEPP